MDEKYRLVFRGEILEGQHRTVVKRRLSEVLKLSEKQMDQLFSGQSVVIKVDVDQQTATRYQTLFKQAGGRLRVQAQAQKQSAPSVQEAPAAPKEPAAPKAPAADKAPAAPRKSAAPEQPTRSEQDPPETQDPVISDGPAFTVVNNYAPPPDQPAAEIDAPDFQVADVGSDLLDAIEQPEVVVPEPDFELAEVGADVLSETSAPVIAEIVAADFDVADVGADIGVSSTRDVPEAPDVSHIRLAEQV